MSRISKYKLNKDVYKSVDLNDNQQEDSSFQMLIGRNEIELNEICLRCQSNEASWIRNRLNYKLVEAVGVFTLCCMSITAFTLSMVYFEDFYMSFQYLKAANLVKTQLFALMPVYYVFLECVACLFDLLRALCSAKLFCIFSNEKKEKQAMERKICRPEDYLIIYSENSNSVKSIEALKLRVSMRSRLRRLFKPLIGLEFVFNIYFAFFLIMPKVLAASYIQINFMSYFKANHTEPIHSEVVNYFNCCLPALTNLNNTECRLNLDSNACVQAKVAHYLLILVFLFYATAVGKFLIQLLLTGNFKLNLIDKLVEKRRLEELQLKRSYEKAKSASFSMNVRARIEQNELLMAQKLDMLENERTKLDLRNKRGSFTLQRNDESIGDGNHHYAEINKDGETSN